MDPTQRTAAVLRCALLVALLVSGSGFRTGAGAQQGGGAAVHATAVQPLSFGLLIPGQLEVVRVTDAARRGVITLEGSGSVQISTLLPPEMTSAEGHRIPLLFGHGSGGIATTPTAAPALFDPTQPQRVTLPGVGQLLWVYLGGAADARVVPPPGSYSATVVMTVTRPNT